MAQLARPGRSACGLAPLVVERFLPAQVGLHGLAPALVGLQHHVVGLVEPAAWRPSRRGVPPRPTRACRPPARAPPVAERDRGWRRPGSRRRRRRRSRPRAPRGRARRRRCAARAGCGRATPRRARGRARRRRSGRRRGPRRRRASARRERRRLTVGARARRGRRARETDDPVSTRRRRPSTRGGHPRSTATSGKPMRLSQRAVIAARAWSSHTRTICAARTATYSSVACTAWPPGAHTAPARWPAAYSSRRADVEDVERCAPRGAPAAPRSSSGVDERDPVLGGHPRGHARRRRAAARGMAAAPSGSAPRSSSSPASCQPIVPFSSAMIGIRQAHAAHATRRRCSCACGRRSGRRSVCSGRLTSSAMRSTSSPPGMLDGARDAAALVLLGRARVDDDHVLAARRCALGSSCGAICGRLVAWSTCSPKTLLGTLRPCTRRPARRAPAREPALEHAHVACSPSRPRWGARGGEAPPSLVDSDERRGAAR